MNSCEYIHYESYNTYIILFIIIHTFIQYIHNNTFIIIIHVMIQSHNDAFIMIMRKLGSHVFSCEVLVLRGLGNLRPDDKYE